MNSNKEKQLQVQAQWIKQYLIPELIKEGTLKGKPSKDTFTLENVSIRFIDTTEAFMLTTCFKVNLTYSIENEKFSEYMVVKRTPNIPQEIFDSICFDTLFKNEITAYTKILPELSKSNGTDSCWGYYPKYFYSCLKKTEACIVLGDFTADGWMMSKKLNNLSLEHLLLAAKLIGKFHGICYDLKCNNREYFNSIIESLGESRYQKDPPPDWNLVLKTAGQRSIKAAKKYYGDKISSEFLNKLSEDLSNIHNQGKRKVKPVEPLAILCHGDYLRNNMAFKYECKEDEDKPTDVMMFDFQTLRYSSPMVDVTILLSFVCGQESRQKNFDIIFKTYCQALKNAYEDRTSCEIPDYLSYNHLLKEYIRYLPYSLGIASSFLATFHEPMSNESSEELLNSEKDEETLIHETMTLGGEAADKELASLVYECYEFSQKFNVNVFED